MAPKAIHIALGEGKALTGKVVDKAGKPVAKAKVSVAVMMTGAGREQRWLMGIENIACLHCTTTADGSFSFTGIPEDATAEFLVRAPGHGALMTMDFASFSGTGLSHTAGQKDIKLTVGPGATIKGRAVRKGTEEGVAGLDIRATNPRDPWGLLSPAPCVTGKNGEFTIEGLGEGTYQLAVAPGKEGKAEWTTGELQVVASSGETVEGIRMELSKGGLIEIAVKEADGGKPIAKANVMLQQQGGSTPKQGVTDNAGLARFRVSAGDYQVNWVHKPGYTFKRNAEVVTVKDGDTTGVELELQGQPKVRGIVVDAEGNPVPAAEVNTLPMGNPRVSSAKDGRFETSWNPQFFGDTGEGTVWIVARHPERNLAAMVENDEEAESLRIVLKAGCTISGRVIGQDDKAIPKAAVTVQVRAGRFSGSIGKQQTTDETGAYTFQTVPAGAKCTVSAHSPDHGQTHLQIEPMDTPGTEKAAADIVLKVADLSVSGIVVDTDEEPVAGARVYAYGNGQSHRQATTDKEGKFVIRKLCEGQLNLNAHTTDGKSHGSTQAEAGANDVQIVLGQQPSPRMVTPKEAPSLAGKSLPETDQLGLSDVMKDASGKPVLMIFWDRKQRPSRHVLKQLAAQADLLTQAKVVTASIHAGPVDAAVLKASLTDLKAPFAAGQIEGKTDKVLFTWGARGLPWLILTNKQHKVIAEGFKVSQLGDLLAKTAPK